jgi:hypothetical protein
MGYAGTLAASEFLPHTVLTFATLNCYLVQPGATISSVISSHALSTYLHGFKHIGNADASI